MTSQQRQARGITSVPNRSRGKRSPLDLLPHLVRSEMFTRLDRGDTLREVQAWIARSQKLKIGLTAISDWNRKRKVEGPAPTNSETVQSGGFEIFVSAPGAVSLTVRVTPIVSTEARA